MSLASKLKERVTIESPRLIDDGYGGKTRTWTPLATAFAQVEPVAAMTGGRERRVGEQREAIAGYRVTLRLRADVSAAMRIIWKHHTLLIHSLHERDDVTLQLLCYEENI